MVGPGNVTSITIGFSQLKIPNEWTIEYHMLSQRYFPNPESKRLSICVSSRGPVIRIRSETTLPKIHFRSHSLRCHDTSNLSRHLEKHKYESSSQCKFCIACRSPCSYKQIQVFHRPQSMLKEEHLGQHTSF